MSHRETRLWGSCLLMAAAGVACNGGSASFNYYDDPDPVVVHHTHVVRPAPVVVERTVIVPVEHVCGPGCGHYYTGKQYVVVERGHRHGPGCGHALEHGRWVVVGKARATSPPPPEPQPKRVRRVNP